MARIKGESIRDYGIRVFSGPFATIYTCPRCQHREQFKSGQRGVGRGHGLRMGGGCYSRMVAHVRKEHPDQPKERK
jgi:hypothetical protein